jgi:hypothetical protein
VRRPVTTFLSTEGLADKERGAFWRQAMSETFVPLTVGEVEADRSADPSGPTGSVG